MTAFWKWLTVIGLAMTPALVLGQSAAATAGIAWHLDPRILVPVIAAGGFVEGMIIAWLGGATTRIGMVNRWCERMRKPKAVAMANKWGAWGGMFLGTAMVGQEPILLALRFLGVEIRKLILPIALSNVVFALVYYGIVRFGLDKVLSMKL
jgi:hypothetical protein